MCLSIVSAVSLVCASLQSRGIDTIGELLEAMGVDGADAQGLFSETGFKNSHPTALFVQTFKEVLTKYPDEFIIQVCLVCEL